MKICDPHNDALKAMLESLGWPPRSWRQLFKCQALIAANAIDQDPNAAMLPGCPICNRRDETTRQKWIKEAAMAITWEDKALHPKGLS
jgi:hypothetical protein